MSPSHRHPVQPLTEAWMRRRPDIVLREILHRTAAGGVRTDCNTRMLELCIATESIVMSELLLSVPDAVALLPLPQRRGNEGPEHRELRRLGLVVARAIDTQALVVEEHRVACGPSSFALIDVFAETRFGRIAVECGARDARDIPRLLKSSIDHVIVMPFAGWHEQGFTAWGFSNRESRPLPRIPHSAMKAAIELRHPTVFSPT